MVLSLTHREAQPIVLENPAKLGVFLQDGQAVDFYNMFAGSILVGEPIILFDQVGIAKRVIGPNSLGTINFGAWVNFLLDPALAADIHQGDKVYFDYDLAVANVTSGYATGVEPTNGILLGHATITSKEYTLGTGNKPIAANTSAEYCAVKMHNQVMSSGAGTVFGTVPNWVTG